MKRFSQLLLVFPVLSVLFALALLTLFHAPDQAGAFDPYENRRLAQVPALTADGIRDGSYFSDLEDYLADHLYQRTAFLQANVQYQLLRHTPSVNGVIVSQDVLLLDNGLYEDNTQVIAANSQEMARRLSAICQRVESYGGTFLFVGVPTQRTVFRSDYPAYMNDDSKEHDAILAAFSAQAEQAGFPCLFLSPDALRPGYSKVDHHFTLAGAYTSYLAICDRLEALGCTFPVTDTDSIAFYSLPNPYLGTYNRKLYDLSPISEQLLCYRSDAEVPYIRYDNGVLTNAPMITLPATNSEYVYYSAYMGGDKAETIVQTNRPGLPRVLIVGDSFTNAIESIFYMSCDEMRSLDLRYYSGTALSDYIADYQPDIVLYIRDDANYVNLDGNGAIF